MLSIRDIDEAGLSRALERRLTNSRGRRHQRVRAVLDHLVRAIFEGSEIFPVEPSHCWLMGRIADPYGHQWEIGKPLGKWPPR